MQIQSLKMNSGFSMPQLGLGTWLLTGETCTKTVRAALKLGFSHIDTAETYGNQIEIGKALKGVERKDVFITSKVWRDNLHFDDVIASAEQTLRDLGVSYLDLLLIHWPNKSIPIEETLDAFHELVDDGLVKYVGVSNFTIRHLKEALQIGEVQISVNQVEFHPCLYQKELLDFCKKNGIILTAYSPLGRGLVIRYKTVKEIANKNGKTPAQVCISWLMQKGIAVIPKAASKEHLKENLGALGWSLPAGDAKLLDALGAGKRLINPEFAEFDYD